MRVSSSRASPRTRVVMTPTMLAQVLGLGSHVLRSVDYRGASESSLMLCEFTWWA